MNPDKKRAASKASYDANPKKKRAASRASYDANPKKKRAASRASYDKNPKAKNKSSEAYYEDNKESLCANRRGRYALAEPKPDVKDMYLKAIQANLLGNSEARVQLIKAFKKQHESLVKQTHRVVGKTVCRLGANRLLNKALQMRKEQAGSLLKTTRSIQSLQMRGSEDFGEGCHTAATEPYYYDSAYQLVKRPYAIPIDKRGRCIVAQTDCAYKTWHCSSACKPVSEADIDANVALKQAFEKPVQEVRHALDTCDDCPNQHYTKVVDGDTSEYSILHRKGHPLICSLDTGCESKLRILRAASTHYPVLRKFLHDVHTAIRSHLCVYDIDKAMCAGDFHALMEITKITDFETMLTNDVESSYAQCTDIVQSNGESVFQPESELLLTHALLITQLEKEIDDFPEHACCSCNQLHQRKSVTRVKLSDSLSSEVWPRLKSFILEQNPSAGDQVLYMCNYCKPVIKNKLPARCVLNGLQLDTIPPELAQLDSLSRQLIQRAKCYQTVVRLGTYTAKVPVYNSLKACKGTMFFLPLPLRKTLETLDQVKHTSDAKLALPNPELYIIVNGRPTKSKVVWRTLVDVNAVKTAIKRLREINWLYREVHDESVDEAAKQVIEVTKNTSSTMLEKASDNDIAGFQAFTIRNLDNKLSTDSDTEQYKVLSVKEDALDNRQQYLDVMCFPVLFPTGKFGEHHPREVKLSHSEYIKSRLLNRDSRFRKDPQYVFYLLWQKELRELSAGVYNLLKCTRSQPMSVSSLLNRVEASDEKVEANLCTMLQSVRGTKQYWFLRQSELRCMIREWGSPTLFLTFSCAEYESPDITNYLRRVNDVPSSYNIGRLCTEDPISVSRKFSLKFHAFFRTVLMKGDVLGKVDHFYWKKEYQARGAPHYHVLLWIRDAPVIGVDDPEKVLDWIQEKITCHIPDKESNPELHSLVTRYQMHKCSAYCKRKRKCGRSTFITRCRFGFPRQACENPKLNSVQDSLKTRNRIYQLARTDVAVRVNDFNPLLLMLWKANIDIQFVAESSLALAHYVSGYVTKAERSNMQEIWEEVSENKSIYGRLWSFGVRSLRFRECGLYEASDLLLGDHLNEKSVTVKWMDVSMPHKRNRRLKDHKVLQQIAQSNPDTEDIFEDNLIDTFYPQRPATLEGVCLYDFVAHYDWQSRDDDGNRKYRKLTKPRLPNHKLFDLANELHREDYYYSLLLLFTPFRDESSLLEHETAEEAFHRLVNADSSAHHFKLQNMLKAQSNIKTINEARQADGEEEKVSKHDDDPQLMGEAKTAMNDVLDMNVNSGNSLSLEDRIAMLNADQRRVFDRVNDHLLHHQRHETNECQCDLKPLQMFVSGVGGTGKSFLIETIKALVTSIWPSDDLTCAIAAPTGLAAFNVGGTIIHRLFQLPIEHEGKSATYWSLPKPSQKVMKTTLRNVKMFIIDEISMVSSINLAYMHLRLEELFGGDEWFGSKNMLFVGDLLQLPPVSGNPVFEKIAKKSLSFKLGCAASVNIWRDSVVYDELTINERQKNDKEFSSMLDCVRRGRPTDETLCTLQERVIQVSVSDKFDELQKAGQTPVCLFPTRKACNDLNTEMLSYLTSEVRDIVCTDEVDETAGTRKWNKKASEHLEKLNNDSNMTAGLEARLSLAVGARVMLRRNIDTKIGLVNGAIGTVLKEVNRLREAYREDLPLYEMPPAKPGCKRKLTGSTEYDEPTAKKGRPRSGTKRKLIGTIKPKAKKTNEGKVKDPPSKSVHRKRKACVSENGKPAKKTRIDVESRQRVWPFRFHPVDEQWQRLTCANLGLRFHRKNSVRPGGPDVVLTAPDLRTIKRILGDGNCLFRSLSYIITGSKNQHMAVRAAILQHMVHIAHFLLVHYIDYTSIQEYIQETKMDQACTWGTEIEMLTASHLLQACVVSYETGRATWNRHSPHAVDRTLNDDVTQMSVYIRNPPGHFEVVRSVQPVN